MITVNKINAYIGLLLVLMGIGICPLLKVPIKGNWNLYQTDVRLFLISLVLLSVCAFCLYIRKIVAFSIMGKIIFGWSVLMAAAVYFKSNNYLGSKFFDKMIAKTISYQWGWIVLLVGCILLVASVKRIGTVKA